MLKKLRCSVYSLLSAGLALMPSGVGRRASGVGLALKGFLAAGDAEPRIVQRAHLALYGIHDQLNGHVGVQHDAVDHERLGCRRLGVGSHPLSLLRDSFYTFGGYYQ